MTNKTELSEKIKKLCSDAEVVWGSYQNSVCHEISDFIKNEGVYNNHNFYEFCKGYVFSKLEEENDQ